MKKAKKLFTVNFACMIVDILIVITIYSMYKQQGSIHMVWSAISCTLGFIVVLRFRDWLKEIK